MEGIIRKATRRIIEAIMDDKPRSAYEADIELIEEARQLLIDIVEARQTRK